MSEREPFPVDGESSGTVPVAQGDATSANAANPMTSADRPLTLPPASAVTCPQCDAGFHETEVGVCANLHPLCRCGAGPHEEREGFCASSHP